MQSMRQRLRPKHHILVMNCYPKYQKNNTDVKPNASELSYLLYYSKRLSKLPKVCEFLEKRNASDVRSGRIGYVLFFVSSALSHRAAWTFVPGPRCKGHHRRAGRAYVRPPASWIVPAPSS